MAALVLTGAAIACTPSPPTGSAEPTTSQPSGPSMAPWTTGVLDQSSTTPALEFRSTGTKLIWSSGARGDRSADVAPDLFAARPGGDATLLYDNPNRDSRLEYIDGVGDQVAFMERNEGAFGSGRWKLWYLAGTDEEPMLIDSGGGEQLPFFGISTNYLIWTVITGRPEVSELRSINLQTMARRVITTDQASKTQYWFPDVDGSRLVYGTVEPSADLSTDERHVYFVDLDGDGTPRRLDQSTSASEPAIHGDIVVWKESDPEVNFLVAGSLVRYSLLTDQRQPLHLPAPAGTGFTDPSIGPRYVAAWPESDRMLYVADLQTGMYPQILDLGPAATDPHDAVGRADLAGDLLAYLYAPAGADLQLRWVRLR
jgi:hypothetical protein